MLEYGLVIGSALFLASMTYMGSKKGFIRLIYSAASLMIAMVLSQCLSVPVTNFVEKNTQIYDFVKERMDIYVDESVGENLESSTEQAWEDIQKSLNLPKSVTSMLFDDYVQPESGFNTDEFCNYVSEGLTLICMRLITTIILFLLITIIMRSALAFFDVFARLPVINEINRLAGAAVGFGEGIIILWILCIVIMAMTGTPTGNKVMDAVDGNAFLSFIYNTNVFAEFFKIYLT
ncbi:MAG: CvpA family protein [Lachnospiraceae bacterium]|nr:CvpA family protein [Lachnospiraceae bacterium]